jgi:hypothetical protein
MASSASEQPERAPAHAAVVFVGHHQAGKSTIVGHIITKLGGLDKRLLERVERETSNRPASRYAWVRPGDGESGTTQNAGRGLRWACLEGMRRASGQVLRVTCRQGLSLAGAESAPHAPHRCRGTPNTRGSPTALASCCTS